MAKTHCDICDRNFKNEEGLEMHNKAKHSSSDEETKKNKKPVNTKKIRNWAILIVILALIVWGFVSLFNQTTLPPTSQQGHIEAIPDSHILRVPMGELIQRHMLEHADGINGGPPGVIINYNCEDYSCEQGLIESLEAFATQYTANVYVAPFPNMGVKIAITREGRIQTLDEYDQTTIDNFIQGF